MEKKPVCAAIIVAAGKGRRMGTPVSKQFLKLAGKEILAHAVEPFEKSGAIDEIILVTGREDIDEVARIKMQYGWKKITAIVSGGAERQDSIGNGLAKTSEATDVVLLHDGVRPFVTEDMINKSIHTAWEMGACTVGVPTKDTIKLCGADGTAQETPDRSHLWQIQTPQAFRRDVILRAYQAAKRDGFYGTDDTSVAEHGGFPVKVIMGDYQNIKITTPEDMLTAQAFLEGRRHENSNDLHRRGMLRKSRTGRLRHSPALRHGKKRTFRRLPADDQ